MTALGAAAQDTAVLLAAAREGSEGWFVTGEIPHSLIVQHLHPLLAKPEGEVQVKPLPLDSAKKCIHAEGHHAG